MTRILLGLGGLAVAASLALFPATGAAHEGNPGHMMADLQKSMKNPMVVKARSKSVSLTIVHVTRGCHLWTDGKRKSAGVKLVVPRGTTIRVTNMDVDAHKLVRVGGPRVALGRPLGMSDRFTLRLVAPGVYRLITSKVEAEEMEMEVETKGEDHVLGLTAIVG